MGAATQDGQNKPGSSRVAPSPDQASGDRSSPDIQEEGPHTEEGEIERICPTVNCPEKLVHIFNQSYFLNMLNWSVYQSLCQYCFIVNKSK